MISSGKSNVTLKELLTEVSEAEMLSYYIGINEVPSVICSPLRKDTKPSFGLYSNDGTRIFWKDFSTGEGGGTIDLLMKLFNKGFEDTVNRIYSDMIGTKNSNVKVSRSVPSVKRSSESSHSNIQVKTREWRSYDLEYWESFGISLAWLKFADVYPISHKIITKGDKTYVFATDKYAYAYVERKEGNVTVKIYQPFNKNGYKWSNSHDSSVISLWTKVPEKGKHICICSSLKDALCLWRNLHIPSLCVQGEGYLMSDTAIDNLKSRYDNIYVLFDNDKPGIEDGMKFSNYTGFKNIIIPEFEGGKDVSDLYRAVGKQKFVEILLPLFKEAVMG